MADRLIASSNTAGLRQLGLHGQAIIAAHRQLDTIIAGRLGAAHARLLALPRVDPNGGRIDWYTALPGDIRKVADLPDAEQAPLRAEAERLSADIASLGASLVQSGGTGELVGRMLSLAIQTPGPEHLYAVGAQPVLVLWAHETEGVATAPVVPMAAPPAAPKQAAAPAEPAAALAAAPAVLPRRGPLGWLLWLLPLLLLLLLAFLGLRACEPLPPMIVEIPDPNPPPPPPDPTPDLAARLAELQAERDRLAREGAARLAQCVPEVREPPQRVEDLPAKPPEPAPEPVPEPKAEVKPPPVVKAPDPPPEKPPVVRPPVREPPPPKDPPPVATAPPTAPPPDCSPTYAPGDEPEVVLVVDGSRSMTESFAGGSSRIDQARKSIRSMVNGLPPGIDVGLVDFRGCDKVRRDRFYSDSERDQLIAEVDGLQPWGGTALARSIERAGNIVSNDVESVIVVVSDGEETCHGDPCAAARALKAAKPNAVINVIDISGDRKGRQVIQCVAQVTGGKVLTPQSPLDFARTLQQATKQPDVRACKG